jgi:hypothetical protein
MSRFTFITDAKPVGVCAFSSSAALGRGRIGIRRSEPLRLHRSADFSSQRSQRQRTHRMLQPCGVVGFVPQSAPPPPHTRPADFRNAGHYLSPIRTGGQTREPNRWPIPIAHPRVAATPVTERSQQVDQPRGGRQERTRVRIGETNPRRFNRQRCLHPVLPMCRHTTDPRPCAAAVIT